MKIAFLLGDFPSFSETFILDQILSLMQKGYQVDIYANKPKCNSEISSVIDRHHLKDNIFYYPSVPNVYLIRLIRLILLIFSDFVKDPILILRSLNVFRHHKYAYSLRLFYAVIPFIQRRPQYDIIQCHFGNNGLLGLKLRQIGAIGGKLYTTFHGRDMSHSIAEGGERVYADLFQEGDFFLPVSNHWQQRLIELGCDSKKIIVHRMGIDCQQFTFVPRSLNLNDKIQVITVARLVEKKGVEYGIKAIARLKERYPNIQYIIVGDGPLRQSLEQLVSTLKLSNWVQFSGWLTRSSVIELLKSSDFFLAPSITSSDGDQEGIPVALMEAMAMGLLAISTWHSGIPELIEDQISGFLAPEKDVDALVNIVSYLIEHPERWENITYQGLSQVEEKFNNIKLNQKLVQIFQSPAREQLECQH